MVAVSLSTSDEFSLLIRQMNRAMENAMGHSFHGFSPTDAFRPSVNLYETEQTFLICVDLAGMDQADIDVQVERGHLFVRGRRVSPLPPDGSRAIAVHLMEIDHGSFCRAVEIPANVQEKDIAATYVRGMLWVSLPKQAAAGVPPAAAAETPAPVRRAAHATRNR